MASEKNGMGEKAIEAFFKGKARFHNIWQHDIAERLKIRRRGIARDAKLDESYDVGTYPPEPSSTTIIDNGGAIKGALIAAAMIAIGAGGATWLISVLNKPPAVITKPGTVIERDKQVDVEVIPPND